MGERGKGSICKTYTFCGRWRSWVILASIAPASSSLSSLSTLSSHIDFWVSRLLTQPFLGTALDIPLEHPCCRWATVLAPLCYSSAYSKATSSTRSFQTIICKAASLYSQAVAHILDTKQPPNISFPWWFSQTTQTVPFSKHTHAQAHTRVCAHTCALHKEKDFDQLLYFQRLALCPAKYHQSINIDLKERGKE